MQPGKPWIVYSGQGHHGRLTISTASDAHRTETVEFGFHVRNTCSLQRALISAYQWELTMLTVEALKDINKH